MGFVLGRPESDGLRLFLDGLYELFLRVLIVLVAVVEPLLEPADFDFGLGDGVDGILVVSGGRLVAVAVGGHQVKFFLSREVLGVVECLHGLEVDALDVFL